MTKQLPTTVHLIFQLKALSIHIHKHPSQSYRSRFEQLGQYMDLYMNRLGIDKIQARSILIGGGNTNLSDFGATKILL